MPDSLALKKLKESLKLAESLLVIERQFFRNPPRQDQIPSVQALRGGAAVLMVGSFEYYLRMASEEHLTKLVAIPARYDFNRLPAKMQIQNIYQTLDRAMKGPLFQSPSPKIHRLPDILQACGIVVTQNINPAAFSETSSNPNSSTVKEMFSNMGIPLIYDRIKVPFETAWGQSVSATFIRDKLDEIVNRRHVIAHTANALNVTRTELKTSLKYLRILAKSLDNELHLHIKNVMQAASI